MPLTVSSSSFPVGPSTVTRSPILIPAVCGLSFTIATWPGPGASPVNVRLSSAPSRNSNGTEGPSSPPRRTVARPWRTTVRTGIGWSWVAIAASAASQSKSASP